MNETKDPRGYAPGQLSPWTSTASNPPPQDGLWEVTIIANPSNWVLLDPHRGRFFATYADGKWLIPGVRGRFVGCYRGLNFDPSKVTP